MNKYVLSLLLGSLVALPACCHKQKCQPCEPVCDETEQCVDAVSNEVEEAVDTTVRKTDKITKF